jgi:hypothetical protein
MSRQQKHTQGPWTIGDLNLSEGDERRVYGPDGTAVVAGVWPMGEDFNDITTDDGEREANARLIAAAPDLLGTLRAFADRRTLTEQDREHIDLVISKAEGRW